MKPIAIFIIQSMAFASFFDAPADAGSINDGAPYQTKQFTANINHRTNLCERQHLLRSGEIQFEDVLRGLELSVVLPYIHGTGYINWDDEAETFDEENPGYWVIILDELANRAGFSWRNSWGVITPLVNNRTTDELLLWSVETYDISFAAWDRTVERMKLGIDFPAGFSDTSTILIARDTEEEETTFNPWSFLFPFNYVVWICIVATVVLTGLLYRWLSRVYSVGQSTLQPRDENVSEHVEGAHIFYAALTATGHMEFRPVTYGERILVFSLCFWSLVIAATYTANLASVMISRHQPIYPATSLLEAQYKGVPVCVVKDYSVETKVKRAYPDVEYVESVGLTQTYEDLHDGKCGLVANTVDRFEVDKLNQTINPDCSLQWVGRAVDISSGGPANVVDAGIFCTSLLGHVFEYYLKYMHRDGFIQTEFENYVNSITTHECTEQEETPPDLEETISLTMVDMGGIFLVHLIACVVGLLVSILQRYFRRAKRKARSRTHNNGNDVEVSPSGQENYNEEEQKGDDGKAIIAAHQLGSGNY